MKFSPLTSGTLLLTAISLSGCDRIEDIPAGNGWAAHDLCTRVLMAGDDESFVRQEYVLPVISPLDLIGTFKVKTKYQKVHAQDLITGSAGASTSVHREGLGCTTLSQLSAKQLRKQHFEPLPAPVLPENVSWPEGQAGLTLNLPYGVDYDSIQTAFDSLYQEISSDEKEHDNTNATLLAFNGELIAEQYRFPRYQDVKLLGWSMSKTVTALLVGILEGEGTISLDETGNHRWLGTEKDNISVRNILHMSSGLGWEEKYTGDSSATKMLFQSHSMAETVADLPVSAYPGMVYEYSTGDTQLLAEMIHRRSGNSLQSGYEFYQQKLFHPLGIEAVIEPDESGVFVGGAYVSAKPQDWLRLGQLVLQRGEWKGEQIVPAAWIDFMSTPSPAAAHYGAQVWLYDEDAMSDYNIPEDVIFFRGFKGQMMAILPSHNAVFLKMAVSHRATDLHVHKYYKALGEVVSALPSL